MTPYVLLPWWGWLLAAAAFGFAGQMIDVIWIVRPSWPNRWTVASYVLYALAALCLILGIVRLAKQ